MTEAGEVRGELEAALDAAPEFASQLADPIAYRWPIAAVASRDCRITIYNSFSESTYCANGLLLEVFGGGQTSSDGGTELHLDSYHCIEGSDVQFLHYDHPINVVATPRGRTPTWMTVSTRIAGGNPDNLYMTFMSWRPGGNPAPNVPFYWRCTVPYRIG